MMNNIYMIIFDGYLTAFYLFLVALNNGSGV